MKITKTQLRDMIREAVRETLNEVTSAEVYERYKELKKEHERDFWIIEKAGAEVLEELMAIRDAAEDYSDFYKKVGPGVYDRSTGFHKRNNKFGLQAWDVKALWDKKTGGKPISELIKLKKEFDKLKDRFKHVSASSKTDMVYGRRRTNVIDTETGEVVSSSTDREGSLGT